MTYIDSTVFFKSATEGRVEFSLVRASSNEEGNCMLVRPSRLGTLICGA